MALARISPAEKEWQAQADLQTLIEAEKIKRDKSRLRAAMTKKRELQRNLSKIK